MNKPSDLAQRRLNAAKQETEARYAALTALADEAAFLMQHFLDRGHDYDSALMLTEITINRLDQKDS